MIAKEKIMKKLLIACLAATATIFFISTSFCIGSQLIYTYDELNRLERIEKPEKYIIDYAYDAVGNRTSKTIIVTKPPTDSDGDGDIDGLDLYDFLINWDGNPQLLSDFANDFGTIE